MWTHHWLGAVFHSLKFLRRFCFLILRYHRVLHTTPYVHTCFDFSKYFTLSSKLNNFSFQIFKDNRCFRKMSCLLYGLPWMHVPVENTIQCLHSFSIIKKIFRINYQRTLNTWSILLLNFSLPGEKYEIIHVKMLWINPWFCICIGSGTCWFLLNEIVHFKLPQQTHCSCEFSC